MKLNLFIAIAAPFLASALPVEPATNAAQYAEALQIKRTLQGKSKRGTEYCYIIGHTTGSNVQCRKGPGTKYDHVAYVTVGTIVEFNCYESGECIDGNCTWDHAVYRLDSDREMSCFVSGKYTDDDCTAAALGKCP